MRLHRNYDVLTKPGVLSELAAGVMVILFQLIFTATSLAQSGGIVFYRVYERVDGHLYYHTTTTDVSAQLWLMCFGLVAVTALIAIVSYQKGLRAMRVAGPMLILLMLGVVYQTFVSPTGAVRHFVFILIALAMGCVVALASAIRLGEKGFCRLCYAVLTIVLFSTLISMFNVVNGSGGWLFGGSVNPGELFKLCVILLTAFGYQVAHTSKRCLGLYFLTLFAMCGGLVLARSLGDAFILAVITLVMMFCFPIPTWIPVVTGVGGGALGGAALLLLHKLNPTSYIFKRFNLSVLTLTGEAAEAHANLRQSLLGVLRGGLSGTGLEGGEYLYTTTNYGSYTDFVYNGITSIFGICGALIIIICFIAIALGGRYRQEAAGGSLVTFQLSNMASALLLIQAIVAIGGNLNILPLTGVTLPFLSTGGSSTLCNVALVGAIIGGQLSNRDQAAVRKVSDAVALRLEPFTQRLHDAVTAGCSAVKDGISRFDLHRVKAAAAGLRDRVTPFVFEEKEEENED